MISEPHSRQVANPLTWTLVRASLRFVETYETVIEALGDRTRRQILSALRHGPASVGELAAHLPVSRPAISQHLQVLRNSRLVTYEEFGTRNVYRLDPTGIDSLSSWLYAFWGVALDRFAEQVRRDSRTKRTRSRSKEADSDA